MARIPYRSASEAPPALAAELAELPPLKIFGLIAHAEGVFAAWRRLAAALLNQTVLDPALRELAILRVAALSTGAEYEWEQHEDLARSVGLDEHQIEAARSGSGLDGDEATILEFTTEVVRDGRPGEPTWERTAAALSHREIVELLLVIGLYMSVARLVATLQIDPDPPVGTELFERLG